MTGETRATTAAADRLRSSLVDVLHDRGTVRTPQIEAALRMVPRHLFLPAASLDEAYADGPVVTKRDGAGVVISTASQPSMIALML
ncbi:MAG: methyltransferase, FxLD system, partial [Actinomycetota bacterium]